MDESQASIAIASERADASVDTWLDDFGRSIADDDPATVAALFAEDATWRDLVAFTWDIRNWEGPDQIAGALALRAPRVSPSGFRRMAGVSAEPIGGARAGEVRAYLEFETIHGRAVGVAHLFPAQNAPHGWRASHLMTQLEAIRGHEWTTGPSRPDGKVHGAVLGRPDPVAKRANAADFADGEPSVVILGGGHNGLALAARLERLNVPTLIIERNDAVGDNWRKRYNSLSLHNYTDVTDLPYMPFPDSFPKFMYKDVFADFLQYYATAMDLKVWTGASVLANRYDSNAAAWEVTVQRADGSQRTVRPRHFVMATGLAGPANIPELAGLSDFEGTFVHAERYVGGQEWTGKRALVIGAGTSGHDICQDLWENGADVTMLQRSSTNVIRCDTFHQVYFPGHIKEGANVEREDMAAALVPIGVLLERGALREITTTAAELDSDLLSRLEAVGFRLHSGPTGSGLLETLFSGRDSFYLDVGASELIADGEIHLKQGTSVARLTARGVEFADGTSMEVELVVAATGYRSVLDGARPVLGDEIADTVPSVWRWGPGKEISGAYKRLEQDGLWFMTGNIANSRYYSKIVALEIAAIEFGLAPLSRSALEE